MIPIKYKKLLNCEDVRCISERDLAICEFKITVNRFISTLSQMSNNYRGNYDTKHPIYGNDSKEKLDKEIRGLN